jgi:hypothetical protein
MARCPVYYAEAMPKPDQRRGTAPTDEGNSSRFSPSHPRLVPDTRDELAEGDSVLTFLAPPLNNDD